MNYFSTGIQQTQATSSFFNSSDLHIIEQWFLRFLVIHCDFLCCFMLFSCSIQPLSHVRLFTTPWITARQASLTITNSRSSLKLMFIGLVMLSSHLILCVPFSSCPHSLLASGSFPMSQLFAWGGQSTGVSASPSVLPMNTQDWSPLGWTGWISLQSKGLSRIFSNTIVQKHQFFGAQLFFMVQLSHSYMTTGKTIALTGWTFVGKVMSLLFICCLGWS